MASLAERYDQAAKLLNTGAYTTAVGVLEDVVAEVPESSSTRLLLARAYYHSGQLGRAEKELRQLVDGDPADSYAHLLLGRTLQRESRHDEAAAHLRRVEAKTGTD